jgi:hypothetical protein
MAGGVYDRGRVKRAYRPGNVKGITPGWVAQARVGSGGEEKPADTCVVTCCREHEGRLAILVSSIEIIPAVDMYPNGPLDTRHHGHPEESA